MTETIRNDHTRTKNLLFTGSDLERDQQKQQKTRKLLVTQTDEN